MDKAELRVVLLGKTGSGKSSLGNTLLGREPFRVARGLSSGTSRCQWANTEKKAVDLQVTDTPGLCDMGRRDEDILREIGKSVALTNPGPHIVLMMLCADKRFTEEEFTAYNTLKGLFGPEIRTHVIIVFSGVDTFGSSTESQTAKLREAVKNCSGHLAEVLADVNGRYIGFDSVSSKNKEQQAQKLIEMMLELQQANGGKYFSSTVCKDISTVVEQLIQQKMSTKKLTRSLAMKAANKSIVEEDAPPSILVKVKSVIESALTSIVEEVTTESVTQYVSESCSMM